MTAMRQGLLGAIEAGGTKFVCAVGSSPKQLAERITIPTTSPNDTFAHVLAFFAQHEPLAAIGVAGFGPLDINPASPGYGTILKTPKPGWSGASFVQKLRGLRVPVKMETDVNGAALAEQQMGAGQGCRTLAYVTVGTGIGVGIVRDDVPISGMGHYEMGHMHPPHDLTEDPFPGHCPFHGDCFEGLAAGPAIMARFGKSLSELPADHAAHDLIAGYLAHLAMNIILTHMPDRIVFGGGVMKTPGLMARLCTQTSELLAGYVQAPVLQGNLSGYIVPPALGDLAGVTGAILLAQDAAKGADHE